MILTAVYTAARRQQLCDLRLRDVDLDKGTITVRQRKAHHRRHSSSERAVPINGQLEPIVERWLEMHAGCESFLWGEGQLAYSKSKRAEPRLVSCDMASDHLKRVFGEMERWKEIAGRWHIFRHSFISLCAVLGVFKSQIQEWVGHLSDEITEHYTHLSKKQAEHAMSRVQLEVDL